MTDKYGVPVSGYAYAEVEADTEEEAREKAIEYIRANPEEIDLTVNRAAELERLDE